MSVARLRAVSGARLGFVSAAGCGAGLMVAIATSPLRGTVQLFEDFDTDPGWDRHNNVVTSPVARVVTQNFGYRTSNFAGNAPGEIGGIIDRAPLNGAYYGLVLDAPLTLEQPLSFSGNAAIRMATHTVGFTSSSDVFVGFFNSQEQGWRPPNFLGFRIHGFNEPVQHVAGIELSYGTSRWAADGALGVQTIFPGATKHSFQVNYNPNVGSGQMTFQWDGGPVQSLDIRPLHRSHGAVFNRFGIFSNQLPGSVEGNKIEAYFDDLNVNGVTYSFASNPGWEGVGNQTMFQDRNFYGTNNFGHRTSNFAGGASPGELGGLFWRVEDRDEEFQGYYADDVGILTLNDRLHASGKIAVTKFSIDSGVMLGWFNSAEQDWPPSNFVGVYMDSFTSVGRHFTPMYGTQSGITEFAQQPWPLLSADGTSMDWTIDYDPDAAGGLGAITVTLEQMRRTLVLQPGAKLDGAILDRFGVFNMQDNNGKHALIYFDDISYTSAIPEPGPVAIMGFCVLAGASGARFGRTRRFR